MYELKIGAKEYKGYNRQLVPQHNVTQSVLDKLHYFASSSV